MSSTLHVRKTPKPANDWTFKLPFKAIIERKFYPGGGASSQRITIGSEELDWLIGIHDGGGVTDGDLRDLEEIIDHISGGGTIDIWFEF